MPIFAQPTPDENLSPGWTSQGTGSAQSTTGIPGQGYATPAAVPAPTAALSAALQASAGFPQPPGAANINGENSGAYGASVLTNPGYADGNTLISGTPLTSPLPSTAGIQSPLGTSATATITGAAITAIYVAPFQNTGIPSGTSSPWVQVATGTAGFAVDINVAVPAAGYVKTVGGNATAVAWTANF